MKPAEEREVRDLYALCHPRWPDPPPHWHFAHPTLVIRQGGVLVGSTSLAVGVGFRVEGVTMDEEVLWGRDVCVHPAHHGHGLGLALCEARFELGRELGLKFFVGMTWPSNRSMIQIFERQGCTLSPQRIAGAFPWNVPVDQIGLMYTRGL